MFFNVDADLQCGIELFPHDVFLLPTMCFRECGNRLTADKSQVLGADGRPSAHNSDSDRISSKASDGPRTVESPLGLDKTPRECPMCFAHERGEPLDCLRPMMEAMEDEDVIHWYMCFDHDAMYADDVVYAHDAVQWHACPGCNTEQECSVSVAGGTQNVTCFSVL